MAFDIEYDERTIAEQVRRAAQQYGDDVFLSGFGRTLTYSEFDERSNRYASGLAAAGVESGDHVAIYCSNRLGYLSLWVGLAKLGAVEVPIDFELTGEPLLHVLRDCDATVLVTERTAFDRLGSPLREIPTFERIYAFEDTNATSSERNTASANAWQDDIDASIYPASDLRITAEPPDVTVDPTDPFAIMYTSGTTGPPKGAVLPNAFWTYAGEVIANATRTTDDDVIFNCFPMSNPTGQLETTFRALLVGAAVHHVAEFSVSSFWDQIRRASATQFVYMGGILSYLLNADPAPDDADNTVEVAWGGGCTETEWEQFERRFNVRILEAYGTTEWEVSHSSPYEDARPGTIGTPVEGFESRVVDDYGRPVGPGELGEIVVRPEHPTMTFDGYYGRPETTLNAMEDCWLHSGDVGYYDTDGYFYFHDREQFVARVNGRMVSPWHVERTLAEHPEITDATAFGVPSPTNPEDEIKAVVVAKDSSLDPAEVVDFCADSLPDHMVPRFVEVRDELRRTHTERIERETYRQKGVGDAWDREEN